MVLYYSLISLLKIFNYFLRGEHPSEDGGQALYLPTTRNFNLCISQGVLPSLRDAWGGQED